MQQLPTRPRPRLVCPPEDQLHRLRQPLTPGERLTLDFFLEHLPAAWEIYLQPHLNGLRPDFVLLHPHSGIAVFEVKDWDLDAVEYTVGTSTKGAPHLIGCRDGRRFSRQAANPVPQLLRYERDLRDLYCPRLDARAGLPAITAGVIFPFADDGRVASLLAPFYGSKRTGSAAPYYPVAGRSALASRRLEAVFPKGRRETLDGMSPELAKDLRHWLVEPDFAATQREPLGLTEAQKACVMTRTKSGFRRIKGPSGSGKSAVIAARAAELAAAGQDVLVVSFNVTLPHYLMDLARRHRPGALTRERITWLHFHAWCKRVCDEAGEDGEYDALWGRHHERAKEEPNRAENTGLDDTLEEVARLAAHVLGEGGSQRAQLYHAILVDEGQDFRPEWWAVLRAALRPGGEMMLAADATQDIYARQTAWTDEAMVGAGFRGEWVRLPESHRMPPELAARARDFSDRFLPERTADPPAPVQGELGLFPCSLRWVQTRQENAVEVSMEEIRGLLTRTEDDVLAFPDVTVLVNSSLHGEYLATGLLVKGVGVVHTFGGSSKEGRHRKEGFYMGDARVKATTIHSFKGWEARALLLHVTHARSPADFATVYTGLTRLKRHPNGSSLTVVCSAPELEGYGRTWPNFEVHGGVRRV